MSPHVQTDVYNQHQASPWVPCPGSGSSRGCGFGGQLLTQFIQMNSCDLSGTRSTVRYKCEIPVVRKYLPFVGCDHGISSPNSSPVFKALLTSTYYLDLQLRGGCVVLGRAEKTLFLFPSRRKCFGRCSRDKELLSEAYGTREVTQFLNFGANLNYSLKM